VIDSRQCPKTRSDPTGDSVAGHWEHFDHGSDIGVRGIGDTLGEAYVQAALAVTGAVANPATVEARQIVDIACETTDQDLLLGDCLNAVIHQMAVRKMLFGCFDVELDVHRLSARAAGESEPGARYLGPIRAAINCALGAGRSMSRMPATKRRHRRAVSL